MGNRLELCVLQPIIMPISTQKFFEIIYVLPSLKGTYPIESIFAIMKTDLAQVILQTL